MFYNLLVKLCSLRFTSLKLNRILLLPGVKQKVVRYLFEAIAIIPAILFIPACLSKMAERFTYSRRTNNCQPLLFYDMTYYYHVKNKFNGTSRVILSLYKHLLTIESDFETIPIVYQCGNDNNVYALLDVHKMKLTHSIPKPTKRDIYLNPCFTLEQLPLMSLRVFNHIFPKSKVSSVFIIHDLLPIQHPRWFEPHVSLLFRLCLHACLRQADLMLSVSQTTNNILTSYVKHKSLYTSAKFTSFSLGSDLHKLKSAVDTKAIHLTETKATTLQFLHVSTIEPRKGHQQLIGAFNILWKRHPEIKLILIGSNGWKNKKLLGQIKTHQFYGTKLIWLSGIDDSELKSIYQQASALIHPSEAEGFGLSIVEAQNIGKPVICRDIPIFREVAIGEGVTFFNTKSSTCLASVIDTWIEGHTKLKLSKPNVRDWQKSTQDLVRLLETLLDIS